MKRALSCGLALIALLSLAWVATPVVLIRPFGAQTSRGLALSYAMRLRSASLTLGLLAAGLVVAVFLYPRLMSRTARILACLAIVVLGGLAWFARHNHFEWMFKPLPHPEFLAADAAEDVTKDDLILGVAAGSEARAYPVRALAYHHVVNDAIGKEPIVATY